LPPPVPTPKPAHTYNKPPVELDLDENQLVLQTAQDILRQIEGLDVGDRPTKPLAATQIRPSPEPVPEPVALETVKEEPAPLSLSAPFELSLPYEKGKTTLTKAQ